MSPAAQLGETVRQHLKELGVVFAEAEEGSLRVDVGTTSVFIHTEERAGRSILALDAPILVDVAASPDQLGHLLELNSQLSFGKFSWCSESRTVAVEYELLGDFLDRDELSVALQAVSSIADTADEKLQPLLGGRLPRRPA